MLYVGHFSFDRREGNGVRGGTFTCLVEAESLDGAADKFRTLILSYAESSESFASVGGIFLDSVIEVRKLPEEGVLTHLDEPLPDRSGSFATTLPGVPAEFCVAYIKASEGEEGEGEQPAFITFGT